jgi:hypothetical protein
MFRNLLSLPVLQYFFQFLWCFLSHINSRSTVLNKFSVLHNSGVQGKGEVLPRTGHEGPDGD